jgi:hypothetical protein
MLLYIKDLASSTSRLKMVSEAESGAAKVAEMTTPQLPPHVTIFSPKIPSAAKSLLTSTLFTRLSLSPDTSISQLSTLRDDSRFSETYSLLHHSTILIFDSNTSDKDVQDTHHDHFRDTCLALKDADISISVAGCVYDAKTALEVGFQFDQLSDGAVLIIDLRSGDEDEDEIEDSDDEGEVQMMTVDEDAGTLKA